MLVFRDGQVAAELSGKLDQDDIVHATFGAVPARGDDPPEPPASQSEGRSPATSATQAEGRSPATPATPATKSGGKRWVG